jgi:hypothetical protein
MCTHTNVMICAAPEAHGSVGSRVLSTRVSQAVLGCVPSCDGLTPATSAPGRGSPPCHICIGTGLALMPHLHQGLGSPSCHICTRDWARPMPHLLRDGARPHATSAPGRGSPSCHICTRTRLAPMPHLHQDGARPHATSAPGRGLPPCHICAGTGLAAAHISSWLGLTPCHICAGTVAGGAATD